MDDDHKAFGIHLRASSEKSLNLLIENSQVIRHCVSSPSSSSSLADEIIDETATSVQDSSANDNVLEDNNAFGDEDAAIEQDNEEDQDAANVGLQDEDVTQEQDQTQDAANTNVDSDVQVGEQVEQQPPPPPPPEEV
jgi:hypothetical protein